MENIEDVQLSLVRVHYLGVRVEREVSYARNARSFVADAIAAETRTGLWRKLLRRNKLCIERTARALPPRTSVHKRRVNLGTNGMTLSSF